MFLKPVTEIKITFMTSGKVGMSGNKMVYAKGSFLWWRLCISSFKTIAYIVNKQSGICRKYLLLQGLYVPSVKTTNMYVIGLKWIIFFKLKWKVWKQIKPNLAEHSRGTFLPPYSNKTTGLKTIPSFKFTYISCILYIRLFWPTSVLTKKLSRRKNVYIKLFLNRFMLTFTANIYLFKASDVVLVFLFLTLNIFHTFF